MDDIIEAVVSRLKPVRGVAAISLGGSRARGTATSQSDYDIGLYSLDQGHPIDIEGVRRAAADLADAGSHHTVTEVGEWGPWIVGGAWLKVRGMPVDFLYRDISALRRVVEDCCAGKLTVAYQPGHPHGFVSSIWMAELSYCEVLHDPAGELAALKSTVTPYPLRLKQATIDRFAWEAGFSLAGGRKAVSRADHGYISGCVFRSFACIAQVLHAINGVYLMNEKGALQSAARLPVTISGLEERAAEIWSLLGRRDYDGAFGLADAVIADFDDCVGKASAAG